MRVSVMALTRCGGRNSLKSILPYSVMAANMSVMAMNTVRTLLRYTAMAFNLDVVALFVSMFPHFELYIKALHASS